MKGRPLILCCWPGLAQLWINGCWSSLFVAIGFAFLLNLALVSTFVWPELLGNFPSVAWPLVLFVWVASSWVSYRLPAQSESESSQNGQGPPNDQDTLFIQAQTEYLKGDWKQAESLLTERLESQPRDVEARLMLATICRRTRRPNKALKQLCNLDRLDASEQWNLEIFREREMIDRYTSDRDATDEDVQEVEDSNQDSERLDRNDANGQVGVLRLGESITNQDDLHPIHIKENQSVQSNLRDAA